MARVLFIDNVFDLWKAGRAPLGLLWLAGALRQAGHEARLVDVSPVRTILQVARDFRPDLLAYSVHVSDRDRFLRLNRRLRREIQALSVFGGPQATAQPALLAEEGVDALCRGEGEEALVEFCNRLYRGESLCTVRNFDVKLDGTIHRSTLRPLLQDLDSLPFPDWDLYRAYPQVYRHRLIRTMTSRGCPYPCSYCLNWGYNRMYRRETGASIREIMRRRSPGNILEELRKGSQWFRYDFVHFEDDVFPLDGEWLREFTDRYPRAIGVPFKINARIDMITPEAVSRLEAAGCHSLTVGIETANEDVRKRVLRHRFSNQRMDSTLNLLRSSRLRVMTANIIGIPSTTLEDDLATLDLNLRFKPDYAICSLLVPLPGTEMERLAVERGLLDAPGGSLPEGAGLYKRSPLRLEDVRKRDNLRALFSLVVRFPVLRPWVPVLISLPLHRPLVFLDMMLRLWIGWRRILPHRSSIRLAVHTVRKGVLASGWRTF